MIAYFQNGQRTPKSAAALLKKIGLIQNRIEMYTRWRGLKPRQQT